jgi:hypothetical protein
MHSRRTLLLATLMVLAVHAWLIAIEVNPLRGGGAWNQLWDPDSYTRLSRVLELRDSGRWYDPVFRGANYPDGFELHWSRLLDLLLLVPSAVAGAVTSFSSALFAWAAVLPLLLHLAAVALLSWGTRPFLGERSFLLLAAFTAVQRGISYDFLPGLVDHHTLQIFLLLVMIAVLVRSPSAGRGGARGGLAGSLAVWASGESLVAVGAIGVGLWLEWVLGGSEAAARRLWRFGVTALAGGGLWLLLERRIPELGTVTYDRLSIAQVGALAGLAVVGAGVHRLQRAAWGSTAARRLGSSALLAGAAGGALLAIFPGFARNPYSSTDAVIQSSLLPGIAAEQLFLPTHPAAAYEFALEMGPVLLALALGAWRLRAREGISSRALREAWRDEDERARLRLCIAASALLAAYAVYALRGIPFAVAACALPWVEGISRLWGRAKLALARAEPGRYLRLGGAALATSWHVAVAGGVALFWMSGFGWRNLPACRWDELVEAVPELAAPVAGGAVLADLFAGPEIHYRTGRPVIGSPYHGNGAGVDATLRLFSAPVEASESELRRRDVRWIALCAETSPGVMGAIRAEPYGLGSLMLIGMAPAGTRRVALPDRLARQFLLLERPPGP